MEEKIAKALPVRAEPLHEQHKLTVKIVKRLTWNPSAQFVFLSLLNAAPQTGDFREWGINE